MVVNRTQILHREIKEINLVNKVRIYKTEYSLGSKV